MATPQPTSGTANPYPQLALAVTLTTALLRGKGSVGRIFLPYFTHPVGTDGRISASHAEMVRGTSVTFLNAVNAQAPGKIAVFGQTGAGTVRPVTGVRVGRVVDTMRSRRRNLQEGYVLAPLVP